MRLLLSSPVTRWQVLAGKSLGHLVSLAGATALGFGFAGVTLQLAHDGIELAAWGPFVLLIGASVLLGECFLAIGYLLSALVRERATAAGLAIGVWLLLVVIFDMALLGVLVADQGRVLTPSALNAVLMFNPTDVYRLLNLTGHENVAMFAGVAGLAEQVELPFAVLLLAQLAWVALPFTLAVAVFQRKSL